MARERITRVELYDLVWAEPMSKACVRFGISDVGLAKVCKRLKVPIPGLGYWRKIEVGQRVRKKALPHAPRTPDFWEWTVKPKVSDSERATIALATGTPEPGLVMRARLALATQEPWPATGTIDSGGARCLTTEVVPSAVERALAIWTLLIGTLESRGHSVCVEPQARGVRKVSKTYAVIGEDRIELELRQRGMFKPSVFTLLTGGDWGVNRTFWREKKGMPFEILLSDVVVHLEKFAAQKVQARVEQKRREEEYRRAKEAERVYAQRRHRLELQAGVWMQAESIRAYIQELETHAASESMTGDPVALRDWIAWAKRHVERIDPIKNHWSKTPEGYAESHNDTPRGRVLDTLPDWAWGKMHR